LALYGIAIRLTPSFFAIFIDKMHTAAAVESRRGMIENINSLELSLPS
jgi:hypothetical protein